MIGGHGLMNDSRAKSPDYYDRSFDFPLFCRHLVQVSDLDPTRTNRSGLATARYRPYYCVPLSKARCKRMDPFATRASQHAAGFAGQLVSISASQLFAAQGLRWSLDVLRDQSFREAL
jgi:hypothetical protein